MFPISKHLTFGYERSEDENEIVLHLIYTIALSWEENKTFLIISIGNFKPSLSELMLASLN